MPTPTPDHQDTTNAQAPRQADSATSGHSAGSSYIVVSGGTMVSDANGPRSPSDRERKEVRSQLPLLDSHITYANQTRIVGGLEETA
jgi:hypothetical protein